MQDGGIICLHLAFHHFRFPRSRPRFYIEVVFFSPYLVQEDPLAGFEVVGPQRRLGVAARAAVLTTSNPAQDAGAAALGLVLVAVEDGEQALPHLAGLLAGVDSLPDARLLVVAHDGAGLLVVGGETLLEGVGVVVGPLDQGLARDVVGHGHLGRVEGQVVAATRGRVYQPARDARHQQGVVDLQLHGVLQLLVAVLQHGVETLGLGNGTGEAVKDEPGRGEGYVSMRPMLWLLAVIAWIDQRGPLPSLALLVVVQLGLDHADDNVVTDEATCVHNLLGLPTQRSLLGDLRPQHVAGCLVRTQHCQHLSSSSGTTCPGLTGRYGAMALWANQLAYQVTAVELLLDLGGLRALSCEFQSSVSNSTIHGSPGCPLRVQATTNQRQEDRSGSCGSARR